MIQHALGDKNIILTGFMGAGKTTVGRLLAARLQWQFIDVDLEIEKKHNMPVAEIFKTMGEQNFRQMEKDYILDLCQHSQLKVVSLGGGAFLQEEIRKVCLETSTVVFLDISWDCWYKRLHLIRDGRPILNNKTIEEIEELFVSRKRIYELSHFKIDTDDMVPEQAADQIIDILNAKKN